VFSLALFPQMYIMERVRRSEVVIILSDPIINEKSPLNRCTIRTAVDKMWHLTVPVASNSGLAADKCGVPLTDAWRRHIIREVTRGYGGLLHLPDAVDLVEKCLAEAGSDKQEWLVDVLMTSFIRLLDELKWEKEVFRGDSLQRRRYGSDSEFLLNLALEAELDSLTVGNRQKQDLNQKLFRKNGIGLAAQQWQRPTGMGAHDCILDVVARNGLAKAKAMF
jgi:hypothetical protein